MDKSILYTFVAISLLEKLCVQRVEFVIVNNDIVNIILFLYTYTNKTGSSSFGDSFSFVLS